MLEVFQSSIDSIYIGLSNLLPVALVFFLLAIFFNGKKTYSVLKSAFPNGVFNIAIMTFNIIVVTPIVVILSQFLHKYFATNFQFWSFVPSVVVIFIAVFIGDFVGYWRHRLEHSRLLWPSHSVHHSDTRMTWLTLQRFHPINRLSTYIIDSVVLIILGFPDYAIIANNLVRHYYGYFIHANLPWTYGKWSLLFVSPAMHRWHHAQEPVAHNTNFATVFSVFDRYFGTYRVPGVCNAQLGVAGFESKGLIGQLLYPFRRHSYIRIKEGDKK